MITFISPALIARNTNTLKVLRSTLFSVCMGLLSLNVAHADEYSAASQLIANKQFDAAMKQIDAAIATKPNDAQWRFLKGLTQTQSGQIAAATQTLIQLTQEFPELAEPYNNLAVIYASQGRLGEARLALEAALRNQPNLIPANENLGDIYIQMAMQAYDKAQNGNPSNAMLKSKLERLRKVLPTAQ